MKLRRKIYLFASVLFAVLLIAVNVTAYLVFDRMSLLNELKRAEGEADSIVKGLQQSAGTVPPDDLLRAFAPLEGLLRIVRPDGKSSSPVITSGDLGLSELPFKYEAERRAERIVVGETGYAWVSVPVIWTDGEVVNVQVMESMAETENRLSVLRSVLFGVTLIALIPVLLSSRMLADRMLRPISSMIGTMKEILSSGQFKRLSLRGPSKDELNEMGETFNRMMDMLESSFERQERFVSDASHELKTPLTIIESYASLLQRRGREKEEIFEEAVEAILSESVRMREMTETLLMLARKPEQWKVEQEEVDITRLAEESVRAFINAYHRNIELQADKPVVQITDRSKLKQLLFILLDNARKYSELDMTVEVGSNEAEQWITVIDRGVGIPKDELDKVFDRFYRVDPARTRNPGAGGSGLGLSLAKDLADAIGAKIQLDSTEGAGTSASIIFPRSGGNLIKF